MAKEEKNKELNGKATFIPIIKGGEVIQLNINGGVVPLSRNIPFTEFTEKLMPMLINLETYIDLNRIITKKGKRKSKLFTTPWDKTSFSSFWDGLTEKQADLLNVIYSNEEISRTHILDDLIKKKHFKRDAKLKGNFAGLSAGLSRKWNTLELEPLWTIKKDMYIINPNVIDVITEVFEEMEE